MASGESSTLRRRRWRNLLAWLEVHGFQAHNIPVECREMTDAPGNGLFTRTACTPGSRLFVVPPRAMMNKMTLKRLYPANVRVDKALTAVQLISLHLFIWRPKADEDSADPFFGPYISMLPRDFGGHPLTWFVLSRLNKMDPLRTTLLAGLPPGVLAALHRLYIRFWDDWCVVQTFLQQTSSIAFLTQVPSDGFEAPDPVMDFLWAWLNVNTRSIYYRLKQTKADPDNLSMCPILDFANHTPSQAHVIPVPSTSDVRDVAPINSIGDGLKLIFPHNLKIEENDEVLLTYGVHSNKTLFVEYGFVNHMSKNGPLPSGEVEVQDVVEKYVFTDAQHGEAARATLAGEGYWGDWTLYSTSDSAQPSWRLITTLRLYHLLVSVGSADEDAIQPWRDVVAGKRHQVSCENEQSYRKSVVFLCDMLIERAEKSIASNSAQSEDVKDSWAKWMSGNIQMLWEEELFVARAVKECVLRGEEF